MSDSFPFNALNCSGTSDPDGSGCAVGFAPTMNITLPDVGLPVIQLTLPDFSGMSIEGIIKALELIGISPCAFIQALTAPVSQMIGELESAIQNSINQVAQLPQDIANEIESELQNGIDGMANGLDFSNFTCEGLVGLANQAITDITGLEGSVSSLEGSVSSLQDQVNSLDSDVNNP